MNARREMRNISGAILNQEAGDTVLQILFTKKVQYSTVQYSTVQYRYSTVQVQYSTVQYSTGTGTVQYSTVQYSTVQKIILVNHRTTAQYYLEAVHCAVQYRKYTKDSTEEPLQTVHYSTISKLVQQSMHYMVNGQVQYYQLVTYTYTQYNT